MNGPFIHTKNSTSKIMRNILISLIPFVLFAFYKNGLALLFRGEINLFESLKPLFLIVICAGSTFLFETLYALIFIKNIEIKTYIKKSYAYLPGIILSLIIPINTPIIVIVLTCLVSTIIGRMIRGGYSKSLFNTVAMSVILIGVFSIISGGYSYLNASETTKYALSPLQNAKEIGSISYSELVKPYGDFKQFFVGNVPGGMGEVSILICIISLIYLAIKKAIKLIIPVSIIITSLIGFILIGIINGAGLNFALFNILTGAIVFAALFVAPEMLNSPVTKKGQIIYGVLIGALTVLLRLVLPFGDIFIAIFIMNLLVPVIDNICSK